AWCQDSTDLGPRQQEEPGSLPALQPFGRAARLSEGREAVRDLIHTQFPASLSCLDGPPRGEFERELIRERSMAGLKRYRGQYDAGKVGKEVHSRSGKDLPVGRPRRTFDRYQVFQLRAGGLSYRQIACQMRIGEGTCVGSSRFEAPELRQKPLATILARVS